MSRLPIGIAVLVLATLGTVATSRPTSGPGKARDFLTPELRARVERLKTEAGQPSDVPDILLDQLDTLWRWANAHSLVYGPTPPDFPYNFAIVRNVVEGGGGRRASLDKVSRFIAASVRELQIKEDRPRAIGTMTLSPPGPFVAGEVVTLEQTYTVGEMPMVPGGGVLVSSAHYQRRMGLQAEDPAGEGYVSVRCSRPGARLEKAEPWGDWGSPLITRPVACYRLAGATLEPGDTITITYGDRTGGGRGVVVQPWTNDNVEMRTFIDLEGHGVMLTPRWPSFEVEGRPEVAAVQAVVRPAVVAPNHPFELAIISQDRLRNVSSGAAPAFDVLLNGRPFRTTSDAGGAVRSLTGLRLTEPGTYRFAVRSTDGRLAATSNPLWVRDEPGPRIWWGDTHGHSSMADGQTSADGYFRYARDVARLDFVTLSEHDIWLDDSEWRSLQRLTRQYHRPGVFTAVLGYEWTMPPSSGGHHNVYFRDAQQRRRVPVQETPQLEDLYRGLRRLYPPEEVLIIPHAHNPGDWRKNDAALERVVEITSEHGTFEWYGNRFLANGFRVGFVGSSDNHSGHPAGYGMSGQRPGLAAVIATGNSPDSLFDALRARSCYATTGERILLDARLSGMPMGRLIPMPERPRIVCRVAGTAPIDAIDVVKNGAVVYTRSYVPSELAERNRVQLRFESSSEVLSGYHSPRGARPWRGTMHVDGGRLNGFTLPDSANPISGDLEVARVPQSTDALSFEISTRGRSKGVVLELEGGTAATRVVVRLEATTERMSRVSPERRPEKLPKDEIVFEIGELLEGPVTRSFEVVEHTDALTARLLPADAPLDQEFEYSDLNAPKQGDYYYLRVHQVDGAMAWSSPWWITEKEKEASP